MEHPEYEKIAKVQDRVQTVGDFLTWLTDVKGFSLCEVAPEHEGKEWISTTKRIEDLMGEYFAIDLIALQAEMQDILKTLNVAR